MLLMNILNNSVALETRNRTIALMDKLNSTMINVFKTKVVTSSWRTPGEHDFLNHLSESIIFVYNFGGISKNSKNFEALIELTEINYEYSANVFAGLIKFLKCYLKESDIANENKIKNIELLNEDTYNLVFKTTKHVIKDSIKSHFIKEHVKLLGNVNNDFPPFYFN